MLHKLLIGISLFAFLLIGYAWFSLPSASPSPAPVSVSTSINAAASAQSVAPPPQEPAQKPDQGGQQITPPPEPNGFTMTEVREHGNIESCWAAINGNVYDLTAWINQHPGGPEHILSICGTDGSSAFNAQHGGQREPAGELAQFFIGPLLP